MPGVCGDTSDVDVISFGVDDVGYGVSQNSQEHFVSLSQPLKFVSTSTLLDSAVVGSQWKFEGHLLQYDEKPLSMNRSDQSKSPLKRKSKNDDAMMIVGMLMVDITPLVLARTTRGSGTTSPCRLKAASRLWSMSAKMNRQSRSARKRRPRMLKILKDIKPEISPHLTMDKFAGIIYHNWKVIAQVAFNEPEAAPHLYLDTPLLSHLGLQQTDPLQRGTSWAPQGHIGSEAHVVCLVIGCGRTSGSCRKTEQALFHSAMLLTIPASCNV